MKIYLIVLTCFLCPKELYCSLKHNQRLEKYLEKQSKLIHEKINEELGIKLNTTVESPEEHIIKHRIPPNSINTKVNMFTFFNETFFLVRDEIFVPSSQGDFQMEPISNFTNNLEAIYLKAIQYKNNGFLAVGHYKEILIFTVAKNSTDFKQIQTIAAPFNADALFFINKGRLYLASAINHLADMGQVIIYEWMGSHFDELTFIYTTGPTILGSFRHKRSEIIVVGQSLPENAKIYSAIYEFKNKRVKKKQYINTYNPTHMDIFFLDKVPHVLIYERRQKQLYYEWNGYEMVLLKTFYWEHKVDKSFVVYSNATPLIVQPQLDKALIYKPLKEDIIPNGSWQYFKNISVILDTYKRENENGNKAFIAGLDEDNIINIFAMSLKVHTEMEEQQEEMLTKCFINLEEKVYDRRRKLNQTKNYMSLVENVEKNATNSRKREAALIDPTDVTSIENKLEKLRNRLDNVKSFIISHEDPTPKPVIVNGKALIKGNFMAKNVTAKNLDIKEINSKKWTPEKWLRYNGSQKITGPSKIHKLSAKVLVINKDTFFKNLLRSQSNQTITGKYKIKKLIASNLETTNINDINVENIYVRSQQFVIKGLKTFDNIFTDTAQINFINNKTTENILDRKSNMSNATNFAPEVFIRDLEVVSIDNINWNDFKDSVFKIGEDEAVKGNLIIPRIDSTKITTRYLNGIDTSHLMTKSTNQIINSSVEFNNIEASRIECNTVNDVDISKSAALNQNGTVIKGPVIIDEIEVKNDLELIGNVNQSLFFNHTDRDKSTNESDYIQRYLGKIIINGNLYVKNLSVLQNTTIFINKNEYSLDSLEQYWTKNTEQEIPVHFEATSGISTSHLNTKILNTMPMENFALNNIKSNVNSPLFFEIATVRGNVFINKTLNNSIELDKLAREGVKNDGATYFINGKKIFRNSLKTNHLQSKEINGKNITGEPKTQEFQKYKKLIIKGDLISDIEADTLNGIHIKEYTQNILSLDKSQNVTEMAFKNVSARNLYVNSINGHNISEYLEKLEIMLSEKHFKTVNVKGNITTPGVMNVNKINEDNIDDFLNTLSNSSEKDLVGDVKFTGGVKLGNLRAMKVNGIDLPKLTKRLLHKRSNQTISGIYTFKKLKTERLYTDKINDKNVRDLIDISRTNKQQIKAPGGITFKNVKLEKSLKAEKMLPCDLHKAVTRIKYPETQEWSKVEIHGNVKFIDENCDLNRIVEKSVRKKEKNVILAPVNANNHVLTQRVTAFNKINGVNLSEIIEDAVLNESDEEQLITGHKIFHNIDAETITVLENTDIPLVNEIYIPELYRRVITKDEVQNTTVLGTKTFFGGLQTNKFFSKKVAGVSPESIVDMENLIEIPKVLFDKLEVKNNFNVKFINSYDVEYILNNRLLANTSEKQISNAVYFFKEFEVLENLKTPSINNIELKNVVFDVDKQRITAPKRFLEQVHVIGNISIGYLNGINISEAYDNSIIHGRPEIINGSLTILKPVRLEGNVTAQTINGYPIEQIKKIMEASSRRTEELVILNITEKIKNIIMETLPAVQHMPNELMYIELSEDLQIKIRNAVDARVTIIKDYALIHVLSEESHIKCNLPEGCKCPVQHTVEITPHLSVSYFLNKGQQRIYSYDDDIMTIHLITNSISTDTKCRTDHSKVYNELSSLTWSTSTSGNVTGSFNVYPTFLFGYISGVEFFTLDGVTYAVIARYYDSVADTHDLDCTVLRFSNDRKTAMEIQKIPTHGARTLYLLHTAQGVIIVISNMASNRYTEIYRFRKDIQKFVFLQNVAYGCTKAVGVVLGTDSLLVLAHQNEPLQVLKYDFHSDNYYHYQMFVLDEPVLGLSVFYVGGFGISDAYLCIVTEEKYRIYSFQYVDGWTLESTGIIKGLRNLIPVELNNQLYLFAPSSDESSLLTIVKHGAGET